MYHPNVQCWSWQLVPTHPLCQSCHTTQHHTFTDGSPLPPVLWHDSGSSSLYHSSIFKLYQLCQFCVSFVGEMVCRISVPVKTFCCHCNYCVRDPCASTSVPLNSAASFTFATSFFAVRFLHWCTHIKSF